MVETSVNLVSNSNEEKLQEVDEKNTTITQIVPAISSSSILNQLHFLKNKWTLWFLNSKKELDWLKRLNVVCTISTVEDFWALYDNIRPPSVLPNCDYNLFKEGIQPMWEVPENKEGGRLVLVVEKNKIELLDSLWLELLLSLIGEQYGEDSEHICGAVCNIRPKGSKISLWTKNAQDNETNKRIGTIMKSCLMASQIAGSGNLKIGYEDHTDVQNKQSSALNCRLVI